MAITYVGATEVNPATAGTSVVISVPAGVVDGDLLVVTLQVANATVPTLPSGWSVWHTASATGLGSWTYWRIAASEPSSYTFTLSVSARHCAAMVAFRGAHVTTPEDVASAHATANTSAQVAFPAITPLTPGAWVLAIGSHITGSGNITSVWSSTNLTVPVDATSTSGATANVTGGIGYYAWNETDGAFTPDMSSTLTTARSISVASVIKPAVPAEGPPAATITTNFLDTAIWNVGAAAATSTSVSLSGAMTVVTRSSYTLQNSRVFWKVTSLPSSGSLLMGLDVYGVSYDYVWRYAVASGLTADVDGGGPVSVAWDASKPFLSVRRDADTHVHYERGSNGTDWESVYVGTVGAPLGSPLKLYFTITTSAATVADVNTPSAGAPTARPRNVSLNNQAAVQRSFSR